MEYLLEPPYLFYLLLLVSTLFLSAFFLPVPLLFAHLREKKITMGRHFFICYVGNFVVMLLLWKWLGSFYSEWYFAVTPAAGAIGVRKLRRKELLYTRPLPEKRKRNRKKDCTAPSQGGAPTQSAEFFQSEVPFQKGAPFPGTVSAESTAPTQNAVPFQESVSAQTVPPTESDTSAQNTVPGQPAMEFCYQCGSRLLPNSRFCQNCGAQIPTK